MDDITLDEYIRRQKGKHKGGPKRPQKTQKPWKPQLLIVEGLPVTFHNEDLKSLFSKFGALTRCNVLFEKTGESKGKGLVGFESEEATKKALSELAGHKVGESAIKVSIKEHKEERKKKIGKEVNRKAGHKKVSKEDNRKTGNKKSSHKDRRPKERRESGEIKGSKHKFSKGHKRRHN